MVGRDSLDFVEFNKNLKAGKLKSVYLFKGSEEYLMDRYLENVRSKYIDDEFQMINYIEVDTNGSFDEILNGCETLPFMSEKKLVFVKDIYELTQEDKVLGEKLKDYLPKVSPSVILIMKDKENRLKKNTRIYKTIDKLAGIVEFNRLNKPQLKIFIKNILDKNKKIILDRDLDYFIGMTNYLGYKSEKSLFEIENEILKIIGHTSGERIAREDIDSNLINDLNVNIFNLIDSIVARDLETSLLIFNNMYRMNEPIARILYMLIRHFRLMMKYKTLMEKGYRGGDISKKMEISSFELKKISSSARNFNESYLKRTLGCLLDFDKRQKTLGLDEKLEMEILLVKLTRIF